eukprot:scaffold19118_cov129-Isochrysis_galbana.AAC.6
MGLPSPPHALRETLLLRGSGARPHCNARSYYTTRLCTVEEEKPILKRSSAATTPRTHPARPESSAGGEHSAGW